MKVVFFPNWCKIVCYKTIIEKNTIFVPPTLVFVGGGFACFAAVLTLLKGNFSKLGEITKTDDKD